MIHKNLLKLCQFSYTDDFSGIDSLQIQSYIGDSIHKYTIEFDDCYVIVFRGSKNYFDLINDFSFNAVDFDHTNVHQGFLTALNAELKPRLTSDKPVYVTGHSLGGALAHLEADRLYEYGVTILEVVTFGAPMVGAMSFKEKYEKKLGDKNVRYVLSDDIVPTLPLLEYVKVNQEIRLGKKKSWFNPTKLITIFTDHKIKNYLKVMEAL